MLPPFRQVHVRGWAIHTLGATPCGVDTRRPHFPHLYAEEARGFLADCEWRDLTSDEAQDLPGAVALRAVNRHWDGGLADFAGAVWC